VALALGEEDVEQAFSLFPVSQRFTSHWNHPLTWTKKTGWKPILQNAVAPWLGVFSGKERGLVGRTQAGRL
jgi:hypothetical protein